MLTLPQQREAPRLVVAINTSPTRIGVCRQLADEDRVLDVLDTISDRLKAGLDGAWLGPDAGRGVPLDPSDTEERWARTVTEMTLGSMYGGCAPSYGIKDVDFYAKMATNGSPYPITLACQQMTTVGLISRGFDKSHFGDGANAGGTWGIPLFNGGGGTWFKEDLRQIDSAVKKSPPVGVGTIYEFYGPAGANSGNAHIGFILRVHRVMDGKAWNAVQFMDTGAMNIANRGIAPQTLMSTYKNYDDPWADPINGPAGAISTYGMGVLPASPGLSGALDRMVTLWPMGFARLVLVSQADKKTVVYATPLLPMHDGSDPKLNFSMARLAWSLRGSGHPDFVQAEWHIHIPVGTLAQSVFNAARGKTLLDFASDVGVGPDQPIGQAAMVRHSTHRASGPGMPSGTIKIDDSVFRNAPDKLPWGKRSGTLLPPLTSVPQYLRGGET